MGSYLLRRKPCKKCQGQGSYGSGRQSDKRCPRCGGLGFDQDEELAPKETPMPETTAPGPDDVCPGCPYDGLPDGHRIREHPKMPTSTTPPDPLTPDERGVVERVRTAAPPKYASGAVSIPITDRDALLALVARLEKRLAASATAEGDAMNSETDLSWKQRDEWAAKCRGRGEKLAGLESQLAAARAAGPVPEDVKDVAENVLHWHEHGNADYHSLVMARWIRSLSPPEAGRG